MREPCVRQVGRVPPVGKAQKSLPSVTSTHLDAGNILDTIIPRHIVIIAGVGNIRFASAEGIGHGVRLKQEYDEGFDLCIKQ